MVARAQIAVSAVMGALEGGIIHMGWYQTPQPWLQRDAWLFMHVNNLEKYSPCRLLPVWVVAGTATLFLMMKSTTASRENYKHTSRGHPRERKLQIIHSRLTWTSWTIFSTRWLLQHLNPLFISLFFTVLDMTFYQFWYIYYIFSLYKSGDLISGFHWSG